MRTFPSINLTAFTVPEERDQIKIISDFMRQASGGLARSIGVGQTPFANLGPDPQEGQLQNYLYLPGKITGQTLLQIGTETPLTIRSTSSSASRTLLNLENPDAVSHLRVKSGALPHIKMETNIAAGGTDSHVEFDGILKLTYNGGTVRFVPSSTVINITKTGASTYTFDGLISTTLFQMSTGAGTAGQIITSSDTLGTLQWSSFGLFAQTASVTHANSTTETTLLGSGAGTLTLPANFFTAGKSVILVAHGYYGCLIGADLQIKGKLGSTTVGDTGVGDLANATTSKAWSVALIITCRTTGATGTVMAQMVTYFENNPFHPQAVNTSTFTVDTTGTLAIDLTADWAAASATNTITVTNAVLGVRY